ncbi:hypothetical protein Pfo_016030 [Paulownia fortunei]|nr:hypothetical protein Pfo_016030 [Paulownia fortunei]
MPNGIHSTIKTTRIQKAVTTKHHQKHTSHAEHEYFPKLHQCERSETCTEIITQSSITNFSSSSPSFYPSNSPPHKRAELEKSKQEIEAADSNAEANFCRKIKNFPPPLTTMRGPSSLQVRRHREGGRLIIEAVEKPFRSSCLQAERSDGRLRLCLLTGFDSEATTTSAREEEVKNGEECGGEMAEEEEIDEPRSDEPENEEFDGEMNLEMGVEKFQRLSRCKKAAMETEDLAERSDGRLRLCFLTGFDSEATTISAGEEEVENGEECGGGMAEEEEIDEPRS